MLYLLDYGAGNVRSLANSIERLGFEYRWVESPTDLDKATKLLFPGVGAFGPAMESLRAKGYAEPLKKYINSGRPYMGICIGMQALFESSSESPATPGLGIIPSPVETFSSSTKSVPHMGWNSTTPLKFTSPQSNSIDDSLAYGFSPSASYYFVHSFRAAYTPAMADWALTLTRYGDETFVSSVQKGNVFATQFHPEKSGQAGLDVLKAWLSLNEVVDEQRVGRRAGPVDADVVESLDKGGLTKRIVACLDVRANDAGDLVVTKGDQYDVREPSSSAETTKDPARQVRNLGKPVDLAKRYYTEGADEITFLNITSFRSCPLHDQPMLSVVQLAAETVFVPLCIGGGYGIRWILMVHLGVR